MNTTDTPLISVIVPVFNIEDYIKQCLSSLQAQTMKDIEIIVIDDGSTDNSGQICDSFAEKDPRFKVIHKNNEGLSAARNDGIDISKGKYIMFVDGDDWVDPEFCETPYNVAEKTSSDVVIFGWTSQITINHKSITQHTIAPVEGIADKRGLLTNLWDSIGVVVWNKMYQRNLFEKVRFPVGRLSEDHAVTHRIIHNAKSVYVLKTTLYHHLDYRSNSITSDRSGKFLADEAYHIILRKLDLLQWGYIETDEVANAAIAYLTRLGRNEELSNKCDSIVRRSRSITNKSIYPRRMILVIIYKISPPLFDLLCIVSGKRIQNISSNNTNK